MKFKIHVAKNPQYAIICILIILKMLTCFESSSSNDASPQDDRRQYYYATSLLYFPHDVASEQKPLASEPLAEQPIEGLVEVS
jgi:hypothetical protein